MQGKIEIALDNTGRLDNNDACYRRYWFINIWWPLWVKRAVEERISEFYDVEIDLFDPKTERPRFEAYLWVNSSEGEMLLKHVSNSCCHRLVQKNNEIQTNFKMHYASNEEAIWTYNHLINAFTKVLSESGCNYTVIENDKHAHVGILAVIKVEK